MARLDCAPFSQALITALKMMELGTLPCYCKALNTFRARSGRLPFAQALTNELKVAR